MRGLLLSWMVAWGMIFPSLIYADPGIRLLAAKHVSAIPAWLPPQKNADFYGQYVSKEDTAIRWTYVEQWRVHERNKAYQFNTGRQAFYGFNLNAANMNEGSQRSQLASYIVRLRMESLLQSYLTREDASGSSKRLGRAYSQIRSGFTLADKEETRVRLVYDFHSDMTRFSVERSAFDCTLMHGQTFGAFSGAAPMGQLSLQVGARLGNDTRAYLHYEMSSDVLESGVSRNLGPAISGIVRLRSPLGNPNGSLVDAVLSLRF